MSESRPPSSALRQLAGAGQNAASAQWGTVPTGHEGMDAVLGGGIGRGRLHELFAATGADAAGAAGFGAILAHRLGGAVLWLREAATERQWRLHGPGLAELGLDPARLLLGVMPDAGAVLRAGADALHCPDLGVAVIELWRSPRLLDLTASRRLQLACEASGVTALLLRIDADPVPSAAATRWSVRAAASRPLEANAPGPPAFAIDLLRRRGGGHGRWRVEWDRDAGCFRDLDRPALSGAVVPLSADRPPAAVIPRRQAG